MRALTSLLVLGISLFASGPRASAWARGGEIGLLPLQGSAPTSTLPATLRAAVVQEAKPSRFFEPHELRALLLQQSEVKAAVALAESRAARSEASFLKMDRSGAVSDAEEALEHLGLTAGRFHSPRLVVRAQVALALALLLDPATPDSARRALAEALAINPALTPDPDRFAPRARALLAEVKQQPRGIREPELAELRALARLTDVDQLLWVALGTPAGQSVPIRILVFDRAKGHVVLRLQQALQQEDLDAQIAAAATRALAPEPRLSASPIPSSRPHMTPPTPTPVPHRQWYARWWVWTLAAAVVAGGVTATVVAASPGESSGVTLHLDL